MNAKYVAPSVKEIDGFKVLNLTFSQDVETIYSSLPEPDPNWSYTDSRGHYHAPKTHNPGPVANNKQYVANYPTLEWVVTETYWCSDCHDQHEEGEYRCKKCGEVVKPGTRPPDPSGTPIAMPVEIRLEVVGNGPEVLRGEVKGQNLKFQKISTRGGFDWMVSEYVGMPE